MAPAAGMQQRITGATRVLWSMGKSAEQFVPKYHTTLELIIQTSCLRVHSQVQSTTTAFSKTSEMTVPAVLQQLIMYF